MVLLGQWLVRSRHRLESLQLADQIGGRFVNGSLVVFWASQ